MLAKLLYLLQNHLQNIILHGHMNISYLNNTSKKWEVIIIITMGKLTLIYIINDQEGFLTFYWWYCNLAHSHFWGPLTDFISIEIHNTQPVCSSAISVLNVNFNKIYICKETCKIIVFNCLNLDSNYQSLVKELKLW